MLKNMALRGLDPELADRLQQAAKQEDKSVNQFVLETMRKRLGLEKEKRFTALHHEMDHLFGKWSEQEFEEIQSKINTERKIDEELWR